MDPIRVYARLTSDLDEKERQMRERMARTVEAMLNDPTILAAVERIVARCADEGREPTMQDLRSAIPELFA